MWGMAGRLPWSGGVFSVGLGRGAELKAGGGFLARGSEGF